LLRICRKYAAKSPKSPLARKRTSENGICVLSIHILYNSEPDKLLSGEILPKKSPAAFLLLPILLFIFMFGWIFYSAAEKANSKASPRSRKQPPKQIASENDLEIGIITEMPQEQAIKE
jgi:hypothetical protein